MDNFSSEGNTTEKWHALIKKELKINDLEQRTMVLESGLNYNPYKDPASVISDESAPHPNTPFSIGHRFINLEESKVNEYLKLLVQYDIHVFSVQYDRPVNWEVLMEGIYPEMLFIDIRGNEECIGSFLKFKSSKSNPDKWRFAVPGNLKSAYHSLDYSGQGPENQTRILSDLKKKIGNLDISRIKVAIDIHPHALISLPFINAIHRLLSGSKLEYIIEASFTSDIFDDALESGIIQAGSIAVWAAVSKVGHLYFNPIRGDEQKEYARLILNIQNLIALESKMNSDNYALNGAYSIEYLTQELLKKA